MSDYLSLIDYQVSHKNLDVSEKFLLPKDHKRSSNVIIKH